MRTDELRFLLADDAWATERVLVPVHQVSAAAFAAAAGPGHVAKRSTLLHCISGTQTLSQRLQVTPVTATAGASVCEHAGHQWWSRGAPRTHVATLLRFPHPKSRFNG